MIAELGHFTVKTLSAAGVGDQLGTQFERLARLGRLLGYRYVHTPPTFSRAVPLGLVARVTAGTSRRLRQRLTPQRVDPLADFLGLAQWDRNVSDEAFRRLETRDVDVAALLDGTDGETTLEQVETGLPAPSSSRLIRLCWSRELYERIPALDQALDAAEPRVEPELDLARCYWERRRAQPVSLPAADGRARLVVHLRLGDSTVVEVAGRTINVVNRVRAPADLEKMLAVDPNRRPITPSAYGEILHALAQRLDPAAFSPIVISDGYRRTFSAIRHAIRDGDPLVVGVSSRDLRRSERLAGEALEQALAAFPDWFRIVGESDRNLQTSIHALASADLVLWGTGGFASNVHTLLRRPGARSLLLHVADGPAVAVEQARRFLDERRAQAVT